MLKIVIKRKKSSYDFKANPAAPDSFANNWKHNSQDDLILMDAGQPIYQCKCQSVANYCFGDMVADTVSHGDTIAPGDFTLKLFVPPRSFHGEIHAITQTKDLDGQWIGRDAMQTTANGFQNGRWLLHDRWSSKLGADTNQAWSAGCFILSSKDLEQLNIVLRALEVTPGDEIPGTVVEV